MRGRSFRNGAWGIGFNVGGCRKLFGGYPELGVPYWGRYNKEYSMLGSILGSLYVGKFTFLGCWQSAYIMLPEYGGVCSIIRGPSTGEKND